MRQQIKIRFQNGLKLETFKKEVFDPEGLSEAYHFVESDEPDVVIFGPYGNDLPPKGNYQRVGYFCENIKPDLSICEWAFGIPTEKSINNPRYKRIQWHGFDPHLLVKAPDYNAEAIAESKTKFCNFLYSHQVPYRERFFKELSKYKRVDAPGRSMNNMPGIDSQYQGDKWEIKKQFLSPYKFTIAFENDIFPGYQTEKLYDAMLCNSLPVYCGDPFIGDIFNTRSFLNAYDYLSKKNETLTGFIGRIGQMDFEDIRPNFLKSPQHRLKRKVKYYFRSANIKLRFSGADFKPLIEQIIALDEQPGLYLQYMQQPWFKNNAVPGSSLNRERWKAIFNSVSKTS
jgi:alpha(1,3/1,4) fucosyltransferase